MREAVLHFLDTGCYEPLGRIDPFATLALRRRVIRGDVAHVQALLHEYRRGAKAASWAARYVASDAREVRPYPEFPAIVELAVPMRACAEHEPVGDGDERLTRCSPRTPPTQALRRNDR
jgi:hypothetical protein